MKIQDRYIDIIEKLGMIFDRITTGEENDNFLLHVLLQEGE